jgi:hypothetical protein
VKAVEKSFSRHLVPSSSTTQKGEIVKIKLPRQFLYLVFSVLVLAATSALADKK